MSALSRLTSSSQGESKERRTSYGSHGSPLLSGAYALAVFRTKAEQQQCDINDINTYQLGATIR